MIMLVLFTLYGPLFGTEELFSSLRAAQIFLFVMAACITWLFGTLNDWYRPISAIQGCGPPWLLCSIHEHGLWLTRNETMPSCLKLRSKLIVCWVLFAAGNVHAGEPLVAVSIQCPDAPVDVTAAIPIIVDIVNNLDRPITHAAFSLTPTANNDETRGITVQAVYRDRMEKGHIPIVAAPVVGNRHAIPVHTIEAGDQLRISLDASKWQIADGWKPGHYNLSVRVTQLRAGPSITMSVTSTLCDFEIRHKATAG
jgi:hypothetical protein